METKLKFIPNVYTQNTPNVDYIQWLKHLDTQLNEPINKKSIKVPKVVMPTNKKTEL